METLIDRATPTIALGAAVAAVSLVAFPLRVSLAVRFSLLRTTSALLALSGGLVRLCSLCSGLGTSSGADDGCDDKALIFVTLGWRCESVRAICAGADAVPDVGEDVAAEALLGPRLVIARGLGFGKISHSGSRSSRRTFKGLVWEGPAVPVCATAIVMDSASDSKL